MRNYDLFAKHYDEIMGNRFSNATQLQKIINKYQPRAKIILELACGTDSVLQHFVKRYDIYGLDISSGMLSLARKKVPSGKFFRQDMAVFRFNQKFDVILCVFDSINHLLKFSDWQKVFKQSYEHLNKGGILIFDMNTAAKLQRLAKEQPRAYWFGKNLMIMDIQDVGNKISNWNVRVFEYKNKNHYDFYEENIREIAFTPQQVKKALRQFRKVEVVNMSSKKPLKKSERLMFVCKK